MKKKPRKTNKLFWKFYGNFADRRSPSPASLTVKRIKLLQKKLPARRVSKSKASFYFLQCKPAISAGLGFVKPKVWGLPCSAVPLLYLKKQAAEPARTAAPAHLVPMKENPATIPCSQRRPGLTSVPGSHGCAPSR